jgi:hypothetical protein
MMMSSTPFYSLSGGGTYNILSTKKRRKRATTTKNKNKNVAASLFQRIQTIKLFSIKFYNSDKILSQKSNEVEKTTNTKKRHQGWSERCSVNINDTSLTAETLVSPRPLLGVTDSALPLPDMNSYVTSNENMLFSSSADENDCWMDDFPRPQNCTSDDDTKSNNILIWSDASVINNHCCSEGTHHFTFDNIDIDSDTIEEFWLQEEHNTFRIEMTSPTNNSNHYHRKHTKRKEDADQISPVKLHAIAQKLSPRSVSSSDELPWTSYNIDNYSCSSTHHDDDTKNIAFPFNNKSLLTSMARNAAALSKRYYTLLQQAKQDDIDRRRRLEQIEVLEGQLEQLLSGNVQGGDDDSNVITTIMSDTALSKLTSHYHCNNDGFSPDERERIISLETLLALKLAENEVLATRVQNLRQFLCHESANDVTFEQLPADVADLDSLLTLNTSYKPHNYWICAGKPIIYCMRCDCKKAHTCYVGQTNEGELWPKVGGHFEDLWRKVQGRRSKKPNDSIMYLTKDFGESSFAEHVVRKHLYNVPSREAVREWGSDMIRITVVGADVQNVKVLVHDVLFSSSVSSEFIEIS